MVRRTYSDEILTNCKWDWRDSGVKRTIALNEN